jgi:succinate dehydrogenase / fumarate reductase iron-sulfur subunit
MQLKVFRHSKGATWYDTYLLKPDPGLTVLNALFQVQDQQDPSISFRYSCRGACCGVCSMLINKVPRLACKTQVRALLKGDLKMDLKPYPPIEGGEPWDEEMEVIVEPLPNLPVIKDLVVDMDPFFNAYRDVEPFFKETDETPEKERKMEPTEYDELVPYTNCFLCGTCYGGCPVSHSNPNFKGPAALAKLFRFALDSREGRQEERLKMAKGTDGWEGCKFQINCKTVCPMDVPQNLAIGKARMKLNEIEKEEKEGT